MRTLSAQNLSLYLGCRVLYSELEGVEYEGTRTRLKKRNDMKATELRLGNLLTDKTKEVWPVKAISAPM